MIKYIPYKSDKPIKNIRGIGTELQRILPKFIPRTAAEVDELMACKVRMYVK